jgi:IclR family acetate operon transcriptional repressor
MHGKITKVGPVKSVDTTLRILESVKDQNGARLGDIASDLDLPKSTVSDHLVTLKRNQYLVKCGNEYRVGLRFLELGDHARNFCDSYTVGKEKIDRLADETGELVHLSVEENGLGVIVYECEGAEAVSLDTFVGRRVRMHCTALGKAMLAYMPEERVEEIIDRYGLPARTPSTITDREDLFDYLEGVRERGYSVSNGERIPELGCVAAPIRNTSSQEVYGAISLCVPTTRMENDRLTREIPQLIRQTADRIELDLRFN